MNKIYSLLLLTLLCSGCATMGRFAQGFAKGSGDYYNNSFSQTQPKTYNCTRQYGNLNETYQCQ